MKITKLFGLTFSLIVASTIWGCGGGGGGTPAPPATVVSGVAAKGLINGGTVNVFAVDQSGAVGAVPIGTGSTNADGSYSVSVGPYSGALLVRVTGGTYKDESASSSASPVPLPMPLRAAVAGASGNVSVSVTPITELAVVKAGDTSLPPTAITSANALVTDLFMVDIIATKPVEPSATAFAAASQSQKDYTILLAGISQLARTSGGLQAALAPLSNDINNAGNLSVASATALTDAVTAFLSGPNNQTGVTDINQTNLAGIGGLSAVVKLSTVGTLSPGTLIGGLEATFSLPTGVTLRADFSNGQPLAGVVTASGAAATGSFVAAKYVPASGAVPGTVTLALISSSGFGVGEFVTINCDVAAGVNVPTPSQFVVISFGPVVDQNGAPISGLTPALTVM
ncbi:hypothetical protein [Geotalea uraniireducens]|uniref:Carboxypeptidase regulatory-like domain-containing protein n=1 Tax=Geotalea uraniireducens (strain Rf4) TaxID=351605 RepID=A5G717_GEOUR|nr:hypothetical protein [Geotalea uraniireducens]ABQ27585.1 hypothetical protein Gura_3429 [Geotalea uraniireducens Rf4]